MPPSRLSHRGTKRKRYTTDAFDGIEELLSDAASHASSGPPDEDEDEDEFYAEETANEAAEEASETASEAEDAEVDEDVVMLDGATEKGRTTQRLPKSRFNEADPDKIYTRGSIDQFDHTLATKRLMHFGPDDWIERRMQLAGAYWQDDLCLPSLSRIKAISKGSSVYSDLRPNNKQQMDENWWWYTEGGGIGAINKRQVLQPLTADEAQRYLQDQYTVERKFVIGPTDQQKFYRLSVTNSVDLREPFPNDTPRPRRGFVLNLGARIACLKWAPSQTDRDQYLAVSLLPDRETYRTSSFEPQPPYATSVQIWKFSATKDGGLDTSVAPYLCMTLCAEMGDVTNFEWCHVPVRTTDRLGLLAYVSSDGCVRVVRVPLPGSSPEHLSIQRACFEAKPPDTVCTHVTWLSSSRIVVACANGCVAIWDISSSLNLGDDLPSNPRPLLYFSIAPTYITSLTTCYPSHPYFLVAISMSGTITLTDLRQPNALVSQISSSGSTSSRQISQPQAIWLDLAQSILSFDDNYTARTFPLRRLFSSTKVGRFRAQCICAAASPCHPCVLVGTTAGEAVAFDPLRRAIHAAKKSSDPVYSQVWFQHEWRRSTEEELADGEGDGESQAVGKNGVSRFVEGFKLRPMALHYERHEPGANARAGIDYTTVYEEPTAISALAWNPNTHVGGWAAAGLADGLLRVEDIAL